MATSISDLYALFRRHPHVSTDTRRIEPGSIFFALRGATFDGNRFVNEALAKGAAWAVADDPAAAGTDARVLVVDDTLRTLQELARTHRRTLGIPILAVAGSNGKTTTKELLRRVLACRFEVCATQGNLNNHIGVPLTLLSLRPGHQFAVVEMGASHPHEIRDLCAIARPDYGYITNFGRAHLEGFGGVEGVIRTKSELYDFLRENDGLAFVRADDPLQMQRSEGIRRYTFSSQGRPADVAIEMLSSLPRVTGRFSSAEFATALSGEYNFTNACAAIAVGLYFGVAPQDIARALASYIPDNNRSQWMERGADVLMMDAYNANPSSMELSLENFARTDTGAREKIAVLGDMFELGTYARQEHLRIASLAAALPFERVYLVGENFSRAVSPSGKTSVFRTFDEFASAFEKPSVSAAYLVKGSRGMRMERFLDLL